VALLLEDAEKRIPMEAPEPVAAIHFQLEQTVNVRLQSRRPWG
jgi:hypothetical protein